MRQTCFRLIKNFPLCKIKYYFGFSFYDYCLLTNMIHFLTKPILCFFLVFVLSGCLGHQEIQAISGHEGIVYSYSDFKTDHNLNCCADSSTLEKVCKQQPILFRFPVSQSTINKTGSSPNHWNYAIKTQLNRNNCSSINREVEFPILLASLSLFGQKTSLLN